MFHFQPFLSSHHQNDRFAINFGSGRSLPKSLKKGRNRERSNAFSLRPKHFPCVIQSISAQKSHIRVNSKKLFLFKIDPSHTDVEPTSLIIGMSQIFDRLHYHFHTPELFWEA